MRVVLADHQTGEGCPGRPALNRIMLRCEGMAERTLSWRQRPTSSNTVGTKTQGKTEQQLVRCMVSAVVGDTTAVHTSHLQSTCLRLLVPRARLASHAAPNGRPGRGVRAGGSSIQNFLHINTTILVAMYNKTLLNFFVYGKRNRSIW